MVHLAIDAVGMKQAGVKTILLDVLAAVEHDARIERATVFTSPRAVRTFDFPSSCKIVESPQPRAERTFLRLWWQERGLPARVAELGADVLLCLHDGGRSPRGVPHATFIERPLAYPDDARRLVKLRHRYRLPVVRWAAGRSCRSAGRVFVDTETERRSVSDLFDVPRERITVILPPPRSLPPPAQPAPDLEAMRACRAGARLLFVGQLFAHKNLDIVIEALPEVRRHVSDMTLFVSGPPAQSVRHAPGVVYLGAVPDGALREAYELATLLVLPSLYETIGLPMLEAMSVGTPVLAADRPYAHDVCEDAACFFDPLSPDDCAQQVVRLLSDEGQRTELARRGIERVRRLRAARPFSRMLGEVVGLVAESGLQARDAAS
jgi:glycosyltransferase involved in cell wall biosynthesis